MSQGGVSDSAASSSSSGSVKLGATLNQGEDIPPANSPATSISSLMSEQSEVFRNSPYFAQSPLGTPLFQRPEYSNSDPERPISYPFISTNIPDSECSSRSSVDGFNLKDTTSEKIKKFRERQKRSRSSSRSDEEAEVSEQIEATRKISAKSQQSSDEKFIGRAIDAPRGRIANIRRESSCSVDNEAAHERLVKATQMVSAGFDDIALEQERSPSTELRRRTPSFSTVLGEPISVVTNAFIPQSCSPSPTRMQADLIKQCYSPSTQQMVRPNISYSPSPRPSPAQSPTRHSKLKFGRSVSPICLTPRSSAKRKITMTSTGEMDVKRVFLPRSNTSPLVTDKTFPYPIFPASWEQNEFNSFSVPHSPGPLRAMTPSSSASTGDQHDNSPNVKDSEEKGMLNEERSEADDSGDSEDLTIRMEMSDQDTTKMEEDLFEAAAAAPLPDDGDEDNFF